ncbi:mitochondrial acidic protein Mam33p [Monosporozyma unispora]|nr:Mitochondrial acidic protein mam33 [Kazachstania unispora]
MFLSTFGRTLSRTTFANVTRTAAFKQSVNRFALATTFTPPARTFFATQFKANQQRQSVSEILRSELKIESDLTTADQTAIFKPYLDKYGFAIVETPGKNEAQIVKQTESGETVRVYFDVAQVANLPFDNPVPEENIPEESNPEEFDSLDDNFANVNVIISNNSDGSAVSFDLLMNLQDHSFYVDSVTPFKSIDEVLNESAEAQYKNDLQYHGPPFSNLDEGLQENLELYLESRGINEELSGFISSYSEFKENNEYISWLDNMKGFFEPK